MRFNRIALALFSAVIGITILYAGLILTIYLQRHELAESKETFRKERFEDSFYRLLGYYRQTRYLGTLECLLEQIEHELARAPYWRILMSQLTIFEVKYIFYTCLVAPENDNLRNLIHRSELSRHRMLESTINHHHLAFYQQIHGFQLVHNKPKIFMPYDKQEMHRIRKRLNESPARAHGEEPLQEPEYSSFDSQE
jgi:hypothetical protein